MPVGYMKRILIPFLVLFIFSVVRCDKGEPDPSPNGTRLSQIIVDKVGVDYYRFDFVYQDDKLVEIEHWYNDRYGYDTAVNWTKGSNGVEFFWNGKVLDRIVWNYRTSTQTVDFNYFLSGDIQVTRTRINYEFPTDMHQRSEEWLYDDDRLQRITITDNLADEPDVYSVTWAGEEITRVYKSGSNAWKRVIETGNITSPFRAIIPRKYRQMFLFHHEGFYDHDDILTWSDNHIPLIINEFELDNPDYTNIRELTEGYSFVSNEKGLLDKMQYEEVSFYFHYE